MQLTGPILSFAGSLVVAVLTAVLTVRFALTRFYAEKWWERKLATYASVIESLHHVRNYADTNLDFSLRGRDLPPEGEADLVDKLRSAMADLRKHRDIGNFILSEAAISSMNKLMVDLEASTNTVHWQEHLELKLIAVDGCLKTMRDIARLELRVP